MRRSGKFYRNNEREVVEQLGLRPTKNSGSGWVEKEDGQNDNVICQLKSTDANSIKVSKQDLDTLVYNSQVAHKLPVFAIQFLKSNEVYLVVQPSALQDIAKYLNTGVNPVEDLLTVEISEEDLKTGNNRPRIGSSARARMDFMEEHENKYKKKRRSAR